MAGSSRIATALALALCLLPAAALAAFPGSDPAESPRLNTPNDPDFDRCEADDPDTPPGDCATYFEEEFRPFGFSPDSANMRRRLPRAAAHAVAGTRYVDCAQLDAQGQAANAAAYADDRRGVCGASACRSPASAPTPPGSTRPATPTWRSRSSTPGSAGRTRELVDKVRLNAAELPLPQARAGGSGLRDADDCNGDGAFNVRDFADDPRVADAAGDEEADAHPRRLRPDRDLLRRRPTPTRNGYVDDIAGWDFFDDDNDPFDASSCCSANGHGTGRAPRRRSPRPTTASGGVGHVPRLPAHAAARLGHVRRADRQLRDGRHLRRRQRRQRRRGRGRRAHQHAVRPQRLQLRRRARAWR